MNKKPCRLEQCPACLSGEIKEEFKSWQECDYSICSKCGSWYLSTVLKSEYEDQYWGEAIDPDGNHRVFKNERDFKIKNWYCETVPFVNSLKPGKILDIGAGLGFFLSAIENNWDKHALELSEYGCNFIKENYSDIKVHQGILEDGIYPEKSFDVIMFYHVIEHLENPKEVLKSIRKLIKPGGTLIVGTPNIGSFGAKWFKENYRLLGPAHICLFSKDSLINLMKEEGFHFTNIKYPYWETEYASLKNLFKFANKNKLSPPFWKSIMTAYFTPEIN